MNNLVDESSGVERVTELALGLPHEARAELLNRLHDSLLTPEEREIQNAWVTEARNRLEEVRSGKVEPIDADIVFVESRARFNK